MHLPVDFDEADAKVIAFLVEHFDRKGRHVEAKQISGSLGFSRDEVINILSRFANYGLVQALTRSREVWSIDPQLLSVPEQLRTPPEKDYPREVEKWFRSKRWSVPVWIVFLGLPAVVGYIAMIRTILSWFNLDNRN